MYKFFLGCLLLGLFPQCQTPREVDGSAETSPPTESQVDEKILPINPRMFRRALYQGGKLFLIYGTHEERYAESLLETAKSLAQSYGDRLEVKLVPATDLSTDSLATHPSIYLGPVGGLSILDSLLPDLPFDLSGDSLYFAQKPYSIAQRVWHLRSYPNPLNPYLPLGIITGVSTEAILSYINERLRRENNRFGRSPWDYELIQGDERMMMGYFSHKPEDAWSFDPASQWDYEYHPNTEKMDTYFSYILHGEVAPEPLSQLLQDSKGAIKALQRDMNISVGKWEFPVHIFESAEAKGLELGNTQQAHVEFDKNRVCLVAHEAFPYVDVAPINRMILRESLGKPQSTFLEEGMAHLYSAPWREGGAKVWGKRLHEAGAIQSLEQLFDAPGREESSLIRACVAALWVTFLREEIFPGDQFRKAYLTWNPSPETLAALTDKWEAYLESLPDHPLQRKKLVSGSSGSQTLALKGFNFAHEGYNIYDGYLSQKASLSIQRLNGLGANSIAIVPYTGTGNTQQPSPFRLSNFAGGENDESVVMSNYFAQEEGMKTILKPQIWVRGAWPGDIRMQSQAEWDQFFQYYKKWILHYALLAEFSQIDLFCIGVELKYTTLEQPNAWRSLIKDIRKLYGGPLVYAANWGEEFEGLSFWDDLDYIGIDFYYPLAKKVEVSEKELTKNFIQELQKVEQVAKAYDKSVILTEIGFRSITAPWQMPHDYPGDKGNNAQHQALCYKVVLNELKNHDWCEGIYFWKWPSYIEFTRPNDKDYSPIGKPAEEVLREYF